jgi:hypothetical protein
MKSRNKHTDKTVLQNLIVIGNFFIAYRVKQEIIHFVPGTAYPG